MISLDELKNQLRADFNNRIRSLYIKDICEVCGKTQDLELHHHKKFLSTIIRDSLTKLELNNKKEFTDSEVCAVRGLVGFSQLNKSIYKTVCIKCHDEIHNELSLRGKKVKRTMPNIKEKEIETNYCTMQLSTKCMNKNGIVSAKEFYSANSPFYKNGKYNICKSCLKEYVYETNGNIDINKLKNIFRIYDIPFLEKEWSSAVNDKRETIGVYFKNLYLNHSDAQWTA